MNTANEASELLDQATQLLRAVIARHRGDDLRVVTILTEAVQDIRIGARYLSASTQHAAQP